MTDFDHATFNTQDGSKTYTELVLDDGEGHAESITAQQVCAALALIRQGEAVATELVAALHMDDR